MSCLTNIPMTLVPDSFRNYVQGWMTYPLFMRSPRTRPTPEVIERIINHIAEPIMLPGWDIWTVDMQRTMLETEGRIRADLRQFLGNLEMEWNEGLIRAFKRMVEMHDWYAT